jgi:hypothetical protein
MTARRKGSSAKGWRRIQGEPERIGPLLRECGVLASDADPVECWWHRDQQGRARRIHARYADGWRVTVTLHLGGGFKLSQALTLTSKPVSA